MQTSSGLVLVQNTVRNLVLMLGTLGIFCVGFFLSPSLIHAASIDMWWPKDGVRVSGVQPFKAMLQGSSVEQYEMFWKVGDGQLNPMGSNYTDYPHKEAPVDLSGWRWLGSGPYPITIVAKQGGVVVAQHSFNIYVDTAAPTNQTVATSVVQTTQSTQTASVSSTQRTGGLYVNPNSSAAQQASQWRQSRPQDAAAMDTLAQAPTAVWFGSWNTNVEQDAHSLVAAAASASAMPVIVAYNMFKRDCSGGYSSGGAASPEAYRAWIASLAAGIGTNRALVVLEPDALADIECLSPHDRGVRLSLLKDAVARLKQQSGMRVYLDAGHPGWVAATTMADRLAAADIGRADGFALNVSNFETTAANLAYGQEISSRVGGKGFVVDTSRNGVGSNGQWCNPSGRAIGQLPTLQTGHTAADAYLWLKTPGESDGACNGGPSAGVWWADYALQLVRNAR